MGEFQNKGCELKSANLRDLHSRSSEPPSSQSSNRSHCNSAGTHRWLEQENSDFPQGFDLLTTSTRETKKSESYNVRKNKKKNRNSYSPQSSSSELSPQSFAALQICSVRRQTLSFLQRKGRFGGHGNFSA